MCSVDRQGTEESNILTARSKIGKKSIPGHEVLSANQAAEACKDVIKALKDRPEIQEASPSIVMAGDSICVACLFNPKLQIRNTLLTTPCKGAERSSKCFPKHTDTG